MIRATPLLISSSLFLAATVVAQDAKAPPKSPRLLPGPQRDGAVQLPNQWSLRPTGRHVEVGDYPVQLVIHPSGKWLAILDAGNSDHEVVVVDVAKHEIVSRVTIDQAFYGIAFSPDGARLFASGGEYATVHAFRFAEGFLSDKKTIPLVPVAERFVCGGLSVSADGKELFAAGTLGDSVVPVALGADVAEAPIKTGPDTYPYGILPVGDRLYVSLWGAASVAVIDRKTGAINARWKTESHPTEMALSPDGKTLYVACSNSTKVVSIDVANGTARETIACSLFPAAPSGNTPCSLALSPDGALLFVANADANNLALVNVSKPGAAVPLGFIPTGWYPTSVRFDAKSKRIFVANGKGLGSAPNPLGARPEFKRTLTTEQYIGRLMRGVVSAIPLPEPRQMAELSRTARRCSPLRADLAPSADAPANNPIPAKLGDPSPIKHCIYIIKENRTYDQVFGDDPRGNGDPNLCLFPEKVTPNHHKLVREFVLLDNFYCDGEVSADGHEWTMGAYATDYVEKVWPLTYRGGAKKLGKFGYPSEGQGGMIARPSGGYFFDRCAEAGLNYRSYGEFVENGPAPGKPSSTKFKNLEGHFDPLFRGYDLDYSDVKRAERFLAEIARFEREGELPRWIVLRLPNDHTSGTSPGKLTPTAMVAQNDFALGMVIEGLSKSKFWPTMAVFVVEDDAQNGPDHVDAHRTVALAVSPYSKRRSVDSSLYSTSSMLRTMGLILGTKPLSQFDAAARPMYASFQPTLDLAPYAKVAPSVDIEARNLRTAWGAQKSLQFDLSKEDQADDIAFSEVIWKSVKGANSPLPAPVRAAFFVGKPRGEDDDDD